MFDQNFAYHKVKSNADDSKNILENYVTERQLMVYNHTTNIFHFQQCSLKFKLNGSL